MRSKFLQPMPMDFDTVEDYLEAMNLWLGYQQEREDALVEARIEHNLNQ